MQRAFRGGSQTSILETEGYSLERAANMGSAFGEGAPVACLAGKGPWKDPRTKKGGGGGEKKQFLEEGTRKRVGGKPKKCGKGETKGGEKKTVVKNRGAGLLKGPPVPHPRKKKKGSIRSAFERDSDRR